jgi:hypothetical protein
MQFTWGGKRLPVIRPATAVARAKNRVAAIIVSRFNQRMKFEGGLTGSEFSKLAKE